MGRTRLTLNDLLNMYYDLENMEDKALKSLCVSNNASLVVDVIPKLLKVKLVDWAKRQKTANIETRQNHLRHLLGLCYEDYRDNIAFLSSNQLEVYDNSIKGKTEAEGWIAYLKCENSQLEKELQEGAQNVDQSTLIDELRKDPKLIAQVKNEISLRPDIQAMLEEETKDKITAQILNDRNDPFWFSLFNDPAVLTVLDSYKRQQEQLIDQMLATKRAIETQQITQYLQRFQNDEKQKIDSNLKVYEQQQKQTYDDTLNNYKANVDRQLQELQLQSRNTQSEIASSKAQLDQLKTDIRKAQTERDLTNKQLKYNRDQVVKLQAQIHQAQSDYDSLVQKVTQVEQELVDLNAEYQRKRREVDESGPLMYSQMQDEVRRKLRTELEQSVRQDIEAQIRKEVRQELEQQIIQSQNNHLSQKLETLQAQNDELKKTNRQALIQYLKSDLSKRKAIAQNVQSKLNEVIHDDVLEIGVFQPILKKLQTDSVGLNKIPRNVQMDKSIVDLVERCKLFQALSDIGNIYEGKAVDNNTNFNEHRTTINRILSLLQSQHYTPPDANGVSQLGLLVGECLNLMASVLSSGDTLWKQNTVGLLQKLMQDINNSVNSSTQDFQPKVLNNLNNEAEDELSNTVVMYYPEDEKQENCLIS